MEGAAAAGVTAGGAVAGRVLGAGTASQVLRQSWPMLMPAGVSACDEAFAAMVLVQCMEPVSKLPRSES